ncbi:adapter SH3BGRL isoform X1 [Podarcis raffonei]|uniref:adapter SH3BGRL isoform X1 n=1 Tax=Podarcis raffonei TaxID=65483 RepID=UPI0023293A04|nr:adapter SH3BGRL isoform X1 [Podarcis raffonei]
MVPVPGKGGRAACLRSGSCYDRPEQPQRLGIYAAAAARRLISASPAPYSPRRGGGTEPVPALRLAARLKGNGGGRREGRDSGGSECRDAFPSSRSSCPTIILTQQPLEIKKQQQDVCGFLEVNKIEYEEKDIAANEENRKWMRENIPENCRPTTGNPLPPRIFNDGRYLGNYDDFFEARENNAVYAFLGLTAPPGSKEAEALAKQEA